MRKKLGLIAGILVAAVSVAAITYAVKWNSKVSVRTRNLENKLIHSQTQASVKELIDFEYDEVYVFEPYQPKESMEAELGFKCSLLKETVSEGMTNILFVKDNSPAAYLYGYTYQAGYYIDLPVGKYTKAELDAMNYTVTECAIEGAEETGQTYMKYAFTK